MKHLIGTLAAGLLTLGLTGCLGSGSQVVVTEADLPEEKGRMTFFGNKVEAENVSAIENALNRFMDDNPGMTITYESVKGNAYYEALESRLNTGNGDDLFIVNHDTVLEYAKSGVLADLSDLPGLEHFTDFALEQMQTGESVYFVPTTISAFGLYCNLDLLNKYRRKVPENLAEWEETCHFFKEKGILPIIANNDISLKTLAIAVSFYPAYSEQTMGGLCAQINSGEKELAGCMEKGMELVERFISEGYVDARLAAETEKTSDDLEQFAQGESPFMLTGAWAAGRVKKMADFQFEVYPYPVLEDGVVMVVNLDTCLALLAESGETVNARKFMEFFLQEDQLAPFVDSQCSFSPMKEVKSSNMKEIGPLQDFMRENPVVIGADARMELPIWSMSREACRALLAGDGLEKACEILNQR